MKKLSLAALFLFAFIAAGCATPPVYYNKTLPRNNQQGKFTKDSGYCEMVARGAAPMPQIQITDTGPRYTYGTVYGTGPGGSYTGQYYGTTVQQGGFSSGLAQGLALGEVAANQAAQNRIYASCMASLGWEQVSKDYVPPPQQSQEIKVQVAPVSTEPQKPLNAEIEGAKQRAMDCIQKIESNPAYQGIARHMPLNGNESPTLEQLTDTGLPSNKDVRAIIALHKDTVACREQSIEDLKKFSPGSVPIARQAYDAANLIVADLIQRKITWGEANKKRMAWRDDLRSKLQAAKK